MTKFLREPPKLRTAASVIVVATVVVVVGAGVLFRILDHAEYPTIWSGMWLALQTVTTVGYGDVAPKDAGGRFVAAVVMLVGIAFLSIITAAITSTFVSRAAKDRFATEIDSQVTGEGLIAGRLEDFAQQLNRLEAMLDSLARPRPEAVD